MDGGEPGPDRFELIIVKCAISVKINQVPFDRLIGDAKTNKCYCSYQYFWPNLYM